MRHYLLLLCMFSGLWFSSSAQEHQRWTIGLSGIYGTLDEGTHYDKGKGFTFSPSVRYHLNHDWSIGSALLLPIPSKKNDFTIEHTSGIELFVRRDFVILPKLKASVSAVGLIGTVGAYKIEKYYMDGAPSLHYQDFRWLIGLRPSISYQVASRWWLELGYGFLGYRSNRRLDESYTFDGEKRKGAWGFNSEMGWGNALRLGISYSF